MGNESDPKQPNPNEDKVESEPGGKPPWLKEKDERAENPKGPPDGRNNG